MSDTAPSKSQPWFRKRYIAVVCLLVLGTLIYRSRLSEGERKLLGVWTWQDAPGEMLAHYRADHTLRYGWAPFDGAPVFVRWNIEGDELVYEYSSRSTIKHTLFSKVLRRPAMRERFPLTFLDDGSVKFEMEDSMSRVLIPWSGQMSEEIQAAE